MEPKYVVYQCDNCGKLFYREVAEVLTDDAEDCHVHVTLLPETETGSVEEFPMCACIGGDEDKVIELEDSEDEPTEE